MIREINTGNYLDAIKEQHKKIMITNQKLLILEDYLILIEVKLEITEQDALRAETANEKHPEDRPHASDASFWKKQRITSIKPPLLPKYLVKVISSIQKILEYFWCDI